MAKPRVYTEEQRAKVLELRQAGYTVNKVAEMMGLPEGSIKTITRRDTATLTNPKHQAFFRLPEPAIGNDNTKELALVEPPQKRKQTGDQGIDAFLWLREMVDTGQPALIQQALELAAKVDGKQREEIETRYTQAMVAVHGAFVGAMKSMGLCNIEGRAKAALERKAGREKAVAIFGDGEYFTTPQEQFCIDALNGRTQDNRGFYEIQEIETSFNKHKELMPWTLADCIRELEYWRELYNYKDALFDCELEQETYAREDYVRLLMERIKPRSKEETRQVWEYMLLHEWQDYKSFNPIVENLMGIA